MSYRGDLLKKIEKLAVIVRKKSEWYNSKRPFGHISSTIGKKDYLYEFFCYLQILNDLNANYEIRYVPKSKLFPRKPGNKKDTPYFLIIDKTTSQPIYQVCAGVNITITKDTDYTIAPDISFQSHDASDNPTEKDVYLVMDAKYRSNPRKSKLAISDLREFHAILTDLNLISSSKRSLKTHKIDFVNFNCLITNGSGAEGKAYYCKNRNMKQVENFNLKSKFKVIG